MSIKAVVFDYGGVISYPPSETAVKELENLTGLSAAHLDELNRKYRREYDRGAYNGEEYFQHILSSAGIFLDKTSLWKIAQTDMDGWKQINPDTIQLIHDIKRTGVKVGILSNMPIDFLVWARDHIQIFREVDTAIFSCEHYVVKPEIEIFEKLKDELKLSFEETALFDDAGDNITKACSLGIQGFLWPGPDIARVTLKKTEPVFKNL